MIHHDIDLVSHSAGALQGGTMDIALFELERTAPDLEPRPGNRRSSKDVEATIASLEPGEIAVVMVAPWDQIPTYEVTGPGDHADAGRARRVTNGVTADFLDNSENRYALMIIAAIKASPLFPLADFAGAFNCNGTMIADPEGLLAWIDRNQHTLALTDVQHT